MYKNHLKIAFRNLLRNRGYAAINLLGLALGLGCCLLVLLYVTDEFSYDRFHQEAENIYRIKRQYGEVRPSVTVPYPAAPLLKEKIPEVLTSTRVSYWFDPVIGRGEDFHYESVRKKIEPLILMPDFDACRGLVVRLQGSDLTRELNGLKENWEKLSQTQPFTYYFLDQEMAQFYETERRFKSVMQLGTGLAILIACLGLLGLAAFAAERRTKEIGIRKVMGASVGQLIQLFNRDFLLLVGIAFGLAIPITWWVLEQWLSNFPYPVAITWWIFALAGLFALALALLTVSWQAVRVATSNPVKALRYE